MQWDAGSIQDVRAHVCGTTDCLVHLKAGENRINSSIENILGIFYCKHLSQQDVGCVYSKYQSGLGLHL